MSGRWQSTAVWVARFACIALPWLNPRAGGPSPAVEPWLVSAFLAALLLACSRVDRVRPAVLWAIAAVPAWLVLAGAAVGPEIVMALGAAFVIGATALVAGAGRPEAVSSVAVAWLVAALTSSAIALGQYFGLAQLLEPWISGSAAGEAFANLRQRNQFASLTSIGLVALLWAVQRGLKPGQALAPLLLLAAANAASASRTGALQWLLVGVCVWVWAGPARRQRLALCAAGLLAYAAAALALPWLLERWTGVAGASVFDRFAAGDGCSSRTVLWSNVIDLIRERPWFGWGWGELDYAHYSHLYPGPRFCDILDNAHSLPLHLAVEVGIPAALLACAGMVWLLAHARPWRETEPARQLAWGVLLLIGIHSLLEYPLWYGPFQMAFGLCLGLLWPARQPLAVVQAGAGQSRWVGARVAAAVAAMLAVAYAAWDYRRVSQIYLAPEARAEAWRDNTLDKLRGSWLFRNQVRFAELTITPLTRDNAQWTFDMARMLLHYSPEARVIEKLIESAMWLGREDEALLHLARFRAAFTEEHARWAKAQGLTGETPIPAPGPLRN